MPTATSFVSPIPVIAQKFYMHRPHLDVGGGPLTAPFRPLPPPVPVPAAFMTLSVP